MSRKTKRTKSPAQIAAELERARERRAQELAAKRIAQRNPENWGANEDALALPSNVDVDHLDGHRRRKAGLDWLKSKGRASALQLSAGEKFGSDYRTCNDVSLKSCCDDRVPTGGVGVAVQVHRSEAHDRVHEALRDGLKGHPELIDLVVRVAGEGETVREVSKGDDSETLRNETKLLIALDHLIDHYGMRP